MKLYHHVCGLVKQMLPPACPLCRKTFPAGWNAPFCSECCSSLLPLPKALCVCCAVPFPAADNSSHLCARCIKQPPPFTKVYPVGRYDGTLRTAVHRFKFERQVGLDRTLATLLKQALPEDIDYDLIVPVPLHPQRLRQRSYNQALLLARELARQGSGVCTDLLQKSQETLPQHELTAKERERNLQQVFHVERPLQGEKVLLVDDVMTTGSTLRACSQALVEKGAQEIMISVVCRA